MAICMIHQDQLECFCPCSPYRSQAKTVQQVLSYRLIHSKDFRNFLIKKEGFEYNKYFTMKNKIELCDDHHQIVIDLERNNMWNDFYALVEEFESETTTAKKMVVDLD